MTDVSPQVKNPLVLEEIKEEDEVKKDSFLAAVKKEDEEQEKQPLSSSQKKILVSLLLSIGMTQTLYMNIATLLPIEAKNLFGEGGISSAMIALIIAMFEIAYILSAPIIGTTLKKIGRKNYIVIGYLIIVIGTLGTAFLPFFESTSTFVAMAIIFRFLQGFGDSCVATAVYSIVGIEFPNDREKYVGYCQSACGIGLMSGPVIGSIIYKFLHFEFTFVVFSALMGLCGLLVLFFLPRRLNDMSSEIEKEKQEKERASQSVQEGPQIKFTMFLFNMRAMVTICSAAIAMIFMLFFNAILSEHLIAAYGLAEDQCGYIMALGALFYALASPMVGVIFNGVPRRYVTQLAFIISFVALLYFGPSKTLNYPNGLYMVIIGVCLLGISVALIFVPLLSEIISAVQEKEGLGESPVLNDKASAVFNAAYATGCVSGPLLGGAIKDSFANEKGQGGFSETCDIMSFCAAGFALFYFFVNIVPHFFAKKKKPVQVQIKTQDPSTKSLVIENQDVSLRSSEDLKKPWLNSEVSSNKMRATSAGSTVGDDMKNSQVSNSLFDNSFTMSDAKK